jgi:hypothetical protein
MTLTSDHEHSLAERYTRELDPILRELQERQGQAHSAQFRGYVLGVPLGLVVAFLLFPIMGALGLFIGLVLGLAIMVGISWQTTNAYHTYFKGEVMPRLVELVDPELVYDPKGTFSKTELLQSKLFGTTLESYFTEDFFKGRVGATAFRFAELKTKGLLTIGNLQNGTLTSWKTQFQGIFFVADFNKHFAGATFLFPKQIATEPGSLGETFGAWQISRYAHLGELVKLEDPEFARIFEVRSSDQIEARYILSSSLMQRLIAFCQQFEAKPALAFVGTKVFIAIHEGTNYFEPPPVSAHDQPLSPAELAKHLEAIRLGERIIEDLNLNLRVWSK